MTWISYDLDDRYNIKTRTKKINQVMGALNYFGISPKVEIRGKIQIYLAILVHLFRWGCASWVLNLDLLHKLKVLNMRYIRLILNIKCCDVGDLSFYNKQERSNNKI